MSVQIIPVDPFDYIVFGGTGDLAERKLLPALYHRQVGGQIVDQTCIIGASRSEMSDDEYREFARKALQQFVKEDLDEEELAKFLSKLRYISIDAKSDKGWDDLKAKLTDDGQRKRAYYLAVGPSLFGEFAVKLREHGLITPETRIVVEKPIGRDLESAKQLNDTLGEVFTEDQIFRIDHYLGKETVQNL
ncbi:MAG: glucose-6-phosphate dehydrogenase, partial [Oricola sp.]|nr:glucose-6-phosphate dehydrogenase [Oricola sp.]